MGGRRRRIAIGVVAVVHVAALALLSCAGPGGFAGGYPRAGGQLQSRRDGGNVMEYCNSLVRDIPEDVAVEEKPDEAYLEEDGDDAFVEYGDRVHVTFNLVREDTGEVLDSSDGKEPLIFVCGHQKVFPGVDAGVVGMTIGESRKISLDGEARFGSRDESKMLKVPRKNVPDDAKIGSQLYVPGPDGDVFGTVKELGEEKAVLDLNHPLAGVPLSMTLTVVDIEEQEIAEDGVYVETLVPGDGVTYPQEGDTLTMHYTGRLASNGEEFDCSRYREEPISFTIGVGKVIKGWDLGVMRMSVGERAKLHIPSELAYGARGASGVSHFIPPHADLVFDVELLALHHNRRDYWA